MNVDSPQLQALHKEGLAALKRRIRAGLAAHWGAGVDAAIAELESAKLDQVPETDPLWAWAKLRGADPATVQRDILTRRATATR